MELVILVRVQAPEPTLQFISLDFSQNFDVSLTTLLSDVDSHVPPRSVEACRASRRKVDPALISRVASTQHTKLMR